MYGLAGQENHHDVIDASFYLFVDLCSCAGIRVLITAQLYVAVTPVVVSDQCFQPAKTPSSVTKHIKEENLQCVAQQGCLPPPD